MTDIEILDQMISDKAKVPMGVHNNKQSVTLIEDKVPDSRIEISGIPLNAIIIKIDSFPSPDFLFAGSKGECKRADYAIISESGNKKRILYIEMKRSKHLEKDIILQFKGAECVLAYCIKIADKFFHAQQLLKDYKPRFVTFYHTSIRKRKTRLTRKDLKHNSPEKMMKVQWPKRMQYNHLVGA
ncbi:MAG: hypothetical protein OMM_05730 [Candidatus Magnetoglobus multicellularis str. Araruama]|uniref:Uncharacterized protein n=1 Tax=Candidatus Magnetoglobus multicellularis str. Araruama TaxID=890399 RepID=A0A1V1NUL3_9BACT|nr:MAG: hypothetical protein OMM_05730 [Candidatus Magnetoglobus multicellularis str. Araruama]